MDFELTQSQKDIQTAAREFARGEFDKEVALDLDQQNKFPGEIWKKAAELGFTSMLIPEEYSGQELGMIENTLVVEEFCCTDSTIGSALALSSFGSQCLVRFGSDDLKEKFLPGVARGNTVASWAFRESSHTSNIREVSTTALKDGNKWQINGRKTFVVNGGIAGFYSVLCKTDVEIGPGEPSSAIILVEADREGVSIRNMGKKMGTRTVPTAEIVFENASVPFSNLIGQEHKGLSHALDFFAESRILVGSQALGIAQGAFDRALAYVKQREQFGKKIVEFQITRHKLAEMATKIELARLITYKAAWRYDHGRLDPELTSMAKMYAAQTAVEVADESIQLFGGYGYILDYEVERFYRDAKITELYEGSKEMQRDIIASDLTR